MNPFETMTTRLCHEIARTYRQRSNDHEPDHCLYCEHYLYTYQEEAKSHKLSCIVPFAKEYLHGN